MEQFFLYAKKLKVTPVLVASETFLMMNKKVSDILQRLIGAYMSRVPIDFNFECVHNTTVKRLVGGRGQADKVETALGVLHFFNDVPHSRDHILDLITKEAYDRTDAFAIGIAALRQNNPMHTIDADLIEFITEGLGVFQHARTHEIKAGKTKAVKKATKKKKAKQAP